MRSRVENLDSFYPQGDVHLRVVPPQGGVVVQVFPLERHLLQFADLFGHGDHEHLGRAVVGALFAVPFVRAFGLDAVECDLVKVLNKCFQ